MQQHNGFWISGTAVPGPPYTDYWTPGGAVLFQRPNASVVELVRFNLGKKHGVRHLLYDNLAPHANFGGFAFYQEALN